MKTYLLVISILFTFCGSCQTKKLIISTHGVDLLKIGMSKLQVEKVINAKLKAYVIPDSVIKKQDTATMSAACKICNENFSCNYKGVDFILTFFRYTIYKKSDFELVAISPTSTLPVVETKTGIKTGISEKAFIEICKKNNYHYNLMDIDENNKGCFFSDNLDKESAKVLMIRISNGVVTSLSVVNMIGD